MFMLLGEIMILGKERKRVSAGRKRRGTWLEDSEIR